MFSSKVDRLLDFSAQLMIPDGRQERTPVCVYQKRVHIWPEPGQPLVVQDFQPLSERKVDQHELIQGLPEEVD